MELTIKIILILGIVFLFIISITAVVCSTLQLLCAMKSSVSYKTTLSEYLNNITEKLCIFILALISNCFVICLLIRGIELIN